ncbi:hypothetical protein GGP41_002596 [Bipolaris sorokiniana]|uniref:Uncharacterized protein n=1 Tax=Cochliobolus sativus TaxID=45130 RepID=A0A8H5ZK90_COCSA|nr:hypothetical protein GGP41_002596 [Bipolaris sorokiniana]
MPPYGLYPIPRHHLSPQNAKLQHRRTFNSMDFADAEPAREAAAKTAEQRAQRKLEKRQRKEERRLKKERKAQAEQQQQQLTEAESDVPLQQPNTTPSVTHVETAPQAQQSDATPVATPVKNGRFGPRGPYKKREKTADGTPVSAVKRKRGSEMQTGAPSGSNKNVNDMPSLLDPNFLSSLKEKMGDMGLAFKEAEKEGDEPAKKKRGRPVEWRRNAADAESVKTKTPRGGGKSAVVAPTPASTSKSAVSSTPASARVSGSTLDKSFKVIRTPVPVPSVASTPASTKVAGSTLDKAFNMIKTPVLVPSGASSVTACAKTLVPALQKPSFSISGSTSELQTGKTPKVHPADVLVAETPPSHMSKTLVTTPRQPAIPFPHLQNLFSASKSPMVKGKDTNIDLTSPEEPTPRTNTSTKHIVSSQGSINPLISSQASMEPIPSTHSPAFTASTLSYYKQQLNEKPKARPRRRQRAISEAFSSSSDSTSTTQSVLDMLTRVPKPYGSTFDNPFSTSKKKKNTGEEKHVEADGEIFKKAFKVIQRTVNFSDEEEYLALYQKVLEQSKKAELPCLKSATGCSFRVHDPVSSSFFSPAGALEKPNADMQDSTQRAEAAETFLRHALMARVPVPLGRITGVWRLYCNEYTGQHVDKYSAGMRTLTITSPSSYQGTPVYTARLHIPPRSMAFAIAPFAAPPHAGFRATRMKLVEEGYAMEMVFFGNGYARVRADVGLLLSGKHGAGGQMESANKNKGYGIWHFLAVHERPLYWEPEVDELEVEGKKLFAAYDGIE